jgi:hypothetical protein
MHHLQLLCAATTAGNVACSPADGSLASGSEETSRSVAGGGPSVAQATPQRQHVAAPLAIGA